MIAVSGASARRLRPATARLLAGCGTASRGCCSLLNAGSVNPRRALSRGVRLARWGARESRDLDRLDADGHSRLRELAIDFQNTCTGRPVDLDVFELNEL